MKKHKTKSFVFDDPKKLAEFRNHIICGMTITTACELVGTSTSAWRRYKEAHPEYEAKFKRWKHTLKAQSVMLIADSVLNKKSVEMATYVLDREERRNEARVKAELTRAKAKQIKLQNKIQQRQLEQVDSTADNAKSAVSKLDTATLIRLSHLADGVDDH